MMTSINSRNRLLTTGTVFVALTIVTMGAFVAMLWLALMDAEDRLDLLASELDDSRVRLEQSSNQIDSVAGIADKALSDSAEARKLATDSSSTPGTITSFSIDWVLVDNADLALSRIANSVALLALISNYGGYQTTTSAAGEACINWYLTGEGSVTDCGFERVD